MYLCVRVLSISNWKDSRLRQVITCLYSSLGSPHLECCVQFCKGDLDSKHLIQCRTRKMTKGWENVSRKERLRELGLISLEKTEEGVLWVCINTSWERAKKTEADSSQRCPVGNERQWVSTETQEFCLNIKK